MFICFSNKNNLLIEMLNKFTLYVILSFSVFPAAQSKNASSRDWYRNIKKLTSSRKGIQSSSFPKALNLILNTQVLNTYSPIWTPYLLTNTERQFVTLLPLLIFIIKQLIKVFKVIHLYWRRSLQYIVSYDKREELRELHSKYP